MPKSSVVDSLTPEEDKQMDLIIEHLVEYYFSNPSKFLQPILHKVLESNNFVDRKEKE